MSNNLKEWHALRNVFEDQKAKKFLVGLHWCSLCKSFKDLDEFSTSKRGKFGLFHWCKECHSGTRKGNKKIQSKAKMYNRELKSYYKTLAGGKCARCGYDKMQSQLEYHHVNRNEKECLVTSIINTGKHSKIMYEMDKCILLCSRCHGEFEASGWTAEFVKSDKVGYEIKPGSIVDHPENYWAKPSVKITLMQKSLFDTDENGEVQQ